MNFKDVVIELALVSAGTIADRLIGYNPQIGPKVEIPIDQKKGQYINGVGLAAGAAALVTPVFWKSDSNKYLVHFLTGMFADAVGEVGNLAYTQEVYYEEQPVEEQPWMPTPTPKKSGPFLQVVARELPAKRIRA